MSHPTSPSPSPSSKSWADMAEEDDAGWTETAKSPEQNKRPSNWKTAPCKHEQNKPGSCLHGDKCKFAHPGDEHWVDSPEQEKRPDNWKTAPCKHEQNKPGSCRHGDKCNFAHPGDEHWVDSPTPLTAANVARHVLAPKAVRHVPPKSTWPSIVGGAGEPAKDAPDNNDSVREILTMTLKEKNPEAKDALVRAALALLKGVI